MIKTDKAQWTLLLNLHAGGGRGRRDIERIEKLLKQQGLVYELVISEYPKHAILLAKKAVEKGCRHLMVAGGDGTLNEVVNGIFQQQACSSLEVVIGMIPVGTGNDWIKTFGISNNYEEAIHQIKEGNKLQQDVGKLTYEEGGVTHSRFFTNMAGFGFDALVTQKANQMKEKGRSGMLVYLWSLLTAFVHYQTRKMSVKMDGKEFSDLIFSVSVGIGKYNGGGMKQAPNAIPDNGIFEVTVIKKIGVWGILTNLAGLYSGNYIRDFRVVCFQSEKVEIMSNNSLAGEVDGESLGKSQFRIEILPQKLKVIVGEMDTCKKARI
uniref:diacylglycerol/lipid kinase family protein n=1 Tax=uncultured Draconibacterium sp. TaxID=1573823 RepID=UPI0032162E32